MPCTERLWRHRPPPSLQPLLGDIAIDVFVPLSSMHKALSPGAGAAPSVVITTAAVAGAPDARDHASRIHTIDCGGGGAGLGGGGAAAAPGARGSRGGGGT